MKWSNIRHALISTYILFLFITLGFVNFFIFNIWINETNVEAVTIYVDGQGGGDYTSIQAAINNAQPGDRIIVANGTYYESVVINKTNILLIGNSTTNCKIIQYFTGSHFLNNYSYCIKITASGVNVTGFNIQAFGNYCYGIRLNSSLSSNSNISRNNITCVSNNGAGIYLYHSSNNKIIENSIVISGYFGYGIYLNQSSNNSIISNILSLSSSYRNGIHLYYSSNNHLKRNIISANYGGNGISLSVNSNKNIIIENSIKINSILNLLYEYGVYVSNSSDNNFSFNTIDIFEDSIFGIYITSSSNINLTFNVINITGSNSYSVYSIKSMQINFTQNEINLVGQNGFGIFFEGLSDINVLKNKINTSIDGYGIYLSNTTFTSISENNMTNGGIMISGNLLEHWDTHIINVSNKINDNPIYFFKYESKFNVPNNAAEVILVKCNYTNVSNQNFDTIGVVMAFTNNSVIENSSFNYSNIHIYCSNNNNILNNTITTERDNVPSINILDCSNNNKIYGNKITNIGNRGYGIYFNKSSNNFLTSNLINITGQYGSGIFSFNMIKTNIINNTIFILNKSSNGISFKGYSNDNNLLSNSIISWADHSNGVFLIESSNNSLINNSIHVNGRNCNGIYIKGSSYDFLANNCINNTGIKGNGIHINGSSIIKITKNQIISTEEEYGIYSIDTKWLNLTYNNLTNCSIRISGNSLHYWNTHSIDTTNTINAKPIYYFKNNSNVTLPTKVGEIILANCTEIEIDNSNLEKTWIFIAFSNKIMIENNSFEYCNIYLHYSNNCKLKGNNINYTGFGGWAISLTQALNNHLIENNFKLFNENGIQLSGSFYNQLTNNSINNNGGQCIHLSVSSNNKLRCNKINSINGNSIYLGDSSFNNVINNNINNIGEYGVLLVASGNNVLEENNIINNKGFGIGFWNSNYNNLTNNNLITSGQYKHCFEIKGSKENYFKLNHLDTSGSEASGFFISGSSKNLICENFINTTNNLAGGIFIYDSSSNNVTSNMINTIGNEANGIFISKKANYNLFINNIIHTLGESATGIAIDSTCMLSTLTNNIINTKGHNSCGIAIDGGGAGISTIKEIIKNNLNTTGQRAYGIYIYNADVKKMIKNQINTYGQNAYGIYLYRSGWIDINNNRINTSGERGYGIYQYGTSENMIYNNFLNTYGLRGDGIYLQQSFNNEIFENQINTSGGAYGIFLYQESNNNNITGNIIHTKRENGHGIYSMDSDNNSVLNCNITTSGINAYGFYLDSKFANIINTNFMTNLLNYDIKAINNGKITLINCSFNTVEVTENGGGVLKIKNYLSIQVYDDDGITSIPNVDIEVRDNNKKIYASSGYGGINNLTEGNGIIKNIIVTDRWYYYSNFATENNTNIKVKKMFNKLWEVERPDIDMSISHTEVFYHDITPPAIPIGLKITRITTTNSLNISWDLNQDTVKYLVYSNSSGSWDIINGILHPQNWTLDEDLPDKTWYYYKVQAIDKVGLISELSNVVSYYISDITPPVIPSGLKAVPVLNSDVINVSWNLNPDNPLGYDITWKEPASDEWSIFKSVTHPKTWFILSDDHLINGSKYYFKVRAYYEDILPSDYTPPVKVIHRDYLAPEPPSDLVGKALSESNIFLNWNQSEDTDVQGYRIYINRSGSGINKTYDFLGETSKLEYYVTGLNENVQYYFVVTAFDEANNTSPFSKETVVTTLDFHEQPKVILTIPIQNSTDILVNTTVTIIFNVPMNILTVEKVLEISPVNQYTLFWLKNNTRLQIDFIENLSYNTSYFITIGMAKSETGLVLKDHPFILQFRTTNEKKVKPQIFQITILYPKNGTIVRPGEKIEVIGTSFGFENGTLIFVTLKEMTKYVAIDINGNWSIILKSPEIEGNYSIHVSIGDLNKSVYISVKIDDEIPDKDDEDKKENNSYDKNIIIILTVVIILMIVVVLFMIIRKKSLKKEIEQKETQEIIPNTLPNKKITSITESYKEQKPVLFQQDETLEE